MVRGRCWQRAWRWAWEKVRRIGGIGGFGWLPFLLIIKRAERGSFFGFGSAVEGSGVCVYIQYIYIVVE